MLQKIKDVLSEKGEAFIKIKVRPGAKATAWRDFLTDGTAKIDLAARAEKGRANQELIDFLSEFFKVSAKNIMIKSGAGARTKLIKIVK